MKFTVWAPLAQSVKLELEAGVYSMRRDERGWWSVEQSAVSGQTQYRFIVDDGPATPDPRSRWQPHGVHEASCVWDTAAFATDRKPFTPPPLAEAVIYEMHLGTFTPAGTYRAAREKLPYLRDLGVTYLELLPLATFPGERGWGYDGVYFYAPHPSYGTPVELAEFIDACHQHGLGVLIDVVYNHLGPDGNYLARFGPYFTSHWKTPWGDAINYDGPDSDEVRHFVIENALMWLRDYGFDGLRLDAVQAIIDSRAIHVLEELATRVRQLEAETGRRFIITAESDRNNPRFVLAPDRGGWGLDAHWADDLHHALHAFLTGERDAYYGDFGRLEDVARGLREGYLFQGEYSRFRRRGHGRPPEGVRPEQMIVCTQNHDQVGNRAMGDRLSMNLSPEKLKAAAALVLLSPFTPLLFQGEEWGARTPFLFFTDHHDPKLGEAVTAGRRREFSEFRWEAEQVPDPQDRRTFTRSKLRWEEQEDPDRRDLLEWYRRLLRMRKEFVLPARSDREAKADDAKGWLTLRVGQLLVVCNVSPLPQRVPVSGEAWRLIAQSTGGDVDDVTQELPAWSTTLWTREAAATS